MRNFVDYSRQDELIIPSLFIGYVHWPYRWVHSFGDKERLIFVDEIRKERVPVAVELPEMITITQHQTAGHMCNQLQLFGVFFRLNDLNLYQMAKKHGHEDLMAPVTWEWLVDWQSDIKRFGLRLEHTEHQYAQEAFVPFGGESAWKYVHCKNLQVIPPTGERGDKCKKAFPSFESLCDYLHDAYETARKWCPNKEADELERLLGCIYAPPCGAIIYENCD